MFNDVFEDKSKWHRTSDINIITDYYHHPFRCGSAENERAFIIHSIIHSSVLLNSYHIFISLCVSDIDQDSNQ